MLKDNQPEWMFKEYASDDTQRDSVSGEFFKSTRLEAVIREAIQNSLDAKTGNAASRVRIYYSGNGAAVDGGEYASLYRGGKINPHYAHAKSGLDGLPADDEKCVFMTIEDFNTTGLTGSVSIRPTDEELENDRIKGNYYNYFFRENRSDKAGAGALGSWGAGKIMFMKASRLRTAFTLSVRQDATTPRFLAGRSVMKSHSIGDVTYAPDFWFGIEGAPSSAKRYMTKQPITDDKTIDEFSIRFHLTRKPNELGTSIVIPYLNVENENGNGEFSLDNLVRAVIKNFLLAIIRGELEVTVETGTEGKIVKIAADTIATEKKYLPDVPDTSFGFVTRLHYDLAAKALSPDFDQARTFSLKHVTPNGKPVWTDDMFEGLDLKNIKKVMSEGKQVLFKVPMTVQEKVGGGKSTKNHADIFSVAIRHVDEAESFRTAFYRVGLLIDSASSRSFAGYASVVSVDNGELAKLLVASEPPSHNEWEPDSERVKKSYFNAGWHIGYVVNAVREIVNRIEAADQDPDMNVLIGPFGIPDDSSADGKKIEKKPTKDKSDNDKDKDADHKEKSEIPEEILHFSKFQSKTGFSISVNLQGQPKGYPFIVPYKIGYAPFTKSSWSKFDFELNDASTIEIALENPSQSEIVEWTAQENRLLLKVKKPGAFRLYVTGFDKNRDLEVSKGHYDYSEAVLKEDA